MFGRDVVHDAAGVRELLGLTGQFAAVDEMLTGRETLQMFGRLFDLSAADARARADELLERFDLADAADRPARAYSGGMRRLPVPRGRRTGHRLHSAHQRLRASVELDLRFRCPDRPRRRGGPSAGFVVLFPLVFASSVFVPISSMPHWLRAFAKVRPVTLTADAARSLALVPGTPSSLGGALSWIAGLLTVFIPLSVWRYRRMT